MCVAEIASARLLLDRRCMLRWSGRFQPDGPAPMCAALDRESPAMTTKGLEPADRCFPVGPLAATLAVQTLATAAAYSIPAVAPVVAHDLGVNPALIGLYISTVYGVGILSALL